jgi:hypothetical protein
VDTGVCGTYAGYQRHMRCCQPACGPCARANRRYKNLRTAAMRLLGLEYPQRAAELVRAEVARGTAPANAWTPARRALAREYPDRFEEIIAGLKAEG